MIIYAACDELYFEKYGMTFINSCKRQNHECLVTIINPKKQWNNSSVETVQIQPDDSFQDMRSFYASYRFLVLPKILEQYDDVFVFDIDSIIRKPLPSFDKSGLFLRLNNEMGANLYEKEAMRIAAGVVYAKRKDIEFFRNVRDSYEKYPRKFWFIDQYILYKEYMKSEIEFEDLANKGLCDWEFLPHSYVWSGKGKRKDDPIFKNESLKNV